ncbi:hypothetical protein BB558_007550, partial [Smittium angustum]
EDYKILDPQNLTEWSTMADKGYVWLDKKFRVVIPSKRNQMSQSQNKSRLTEDGSITHKT